MLVLLNEVDNVYKFIFDKIFLVEELIVYLLFEVFLVVDNMFFAVGIFEVMKCFEVLL